MPTIILLDVSLSMSRLVGKDADLPGGSVDLKQLANTGIEYLLDYLAKNSQLEYTAFIAFSTHWEIRQEFTRQHETMRNVVYDFESYDKSNVIKAIKGSLNLKPNEWLKHGPVNIVLITDGQVHRGTLYARTRSSKKAGSLAKSNTGDEFYDIPLSELENQFDFPCKIQVVLLAPPQDPILKTSLPFYKNLISLVDNKSESSDDVPVLVASSADKNFKQSAIWLPQSDNQDINLKSVQDLISKICELHYKPYHTNIACGHLRSLVMLLPKPSDCLVENLKNEFDDLKNELSSSPSTSAPAAVTAANPLQLSKETYVKTANISKMYRLSDEISIFGFMPLPDVASPAVVSRHHIIPINNVRENEISKAEQIFSQDPKAYNKSLSMSMLMSQQHISQQPMEIESKPMEIKIENDVAKSSADANQSSSSVDSSSSTTELSKQPCFCILLETCLKQETMVAICIVGKNEKTQDNWYGMIHAHTDSKKKTSLILSLFNPGPSPISWLPNFNTQGSSMLNANLPQSLREKITSNVTKTPKSYSSSNVIWLDPESVQADIQKIVRQAKRSPDKVAFFYKEVNKVRRAAISYGFFDVLFGLADILMRERKVMETDQSKSANREMLAHIDHVVSCLRANLTDENYDQIIALKQ